MLFVQALLVALWVTWAMIDEQTLQLQTTRAIITGTVVGIIMGDLKTGLIVGATVELMFLASVFVGTAVAPDVTLSAAIATAIAVLSGGGTEVAIATAIPVALIGQTMNTLQYSVVNVAILHWVERGSKKGDLNRVRWGNYIALALNAVFYGLPTFFAVFYGAEYVVAFIDKLPTTLLAGFANGGGMLAAVGFGMLLTTIKCKKLWPYFVIGYIAAAFLGINNVGIGVIAVACVFLHNYFIETSPRRLHEGGGLNEKHGSETDQKRPLARISRPVLHQKLPQL